MHIDPVPAHMAMRVCARDFHVSEYTTIRNAITYSRPYSHNHINILLVLYPVIGYYSPLWPIEL